ncbi:MAG: ribosome maturation factor RimP [Alteromonadaceae bacterium]|nr:MAG: ribosome maturation factor RimP [Alteromonadaceae bacterium]
MKQTRLEELVGPVAESLGCELWGLELHMQGKHSLLRIYIDKADGIHLEDCERVSRQVSSVMDVEDPINGHYLLEVSSPGADRALYKIEHYKAYVGQKVSLKLRVGFEGRKKFTGLLKGVEGSEVVLEVDDDEYLLPYELIDKANIIPTY